MMQAPKIQIFVICHKPAYVPEHALLKPIQVGAVLTQERYEGMQPDCTGDNISEKNPQYCELTAQYWAWKNVECDYYGFFHYRRYLSFETVYALAKDGSLCGSGSKTPYVELDDIWVPLEIYGFDEDHMRQVIVEYDILTVLRERLNTTVYRQYCQYHPKEYLDRMLKILKEMYPEYKLAAERYMDSKDIYYMNMYIMKRQVFQEYMEWLFGLLSEFERSGAAPGEPRLMGYLAERLFGIFYLYQREEGRKCAELPYLKFYNTDADGKGGGQKKIRTFQLKPTKIRIKINMRTLNRMFPAGSRRRIILRSIFLR